MIERIKKVMSTVDEIDDIKASLKRSKAEFDDIKSRLIKAEKEISGQIEAAAEMLNGWNVDREKGAAEISKVCNDFRRELNEFRVMKSQLSSETIERVSADLKSELGSYILGVRHQIEKLNEAAKDIKGISSTTALTLESVNKLRQIASAIKAEDFELTNHAEMLRKNDKEKLDLLRRIDSLERLIGQKRRQSRVQYG